MIPLATMGIAGLLPDGARPFRRITAHQAWNPRMKKAEIRH
jgi:hypothetical protein